MNQRNAQDPAQSSVADNAKPAATKPVYKRVWFWLCIGAVLLIAAAAVLWISLNGNKTKKHRSGANSRTQIVSTTADPDVHYTIEKERVMIRTNDNGSTNVSVAVPMKNTGETNLYLSPSSVELKKENGSVAASYQGVAGFPEVIRPGETAWFYCDKTYDGDAADVLNAVLYPEVKEATVDCIRLNTADVTLSDGQYTGVEIKGRVENQTTAEQSMIYISAALFDADGECGGVFFKVLTSPLKPGESADFLIRASLTNLSAADVASYEIYAYPTQYQIE